MGKIIQLCRLTTFDLGGTPLRYFRPADTAELRGALQECGRSDLPWRVLGGGSNLLVDEGRLPYAVIHVAEPSFDRISRTGPCKVRVGAGVRTARLLEFCKEHGLGGLEFLAGLPATIGGAVAGNAGAWGREISEPLVRLWLVSADGRTLHLRRDEIDFSYRRCCLGDAVITEAEFALQPRHRGLIARQIRAHARTRAERHPVGRHSAGCIFRNPPRAPAGRLLDLCGFKGHRVGGAEVSRKHANFIVNRGDATTRDVLGLIERMREAVRRQFGIALELEVKHWPAEGRVA